MPAFDHRRYTPLPSQVEDLANGAPLPVRMPGSSDGFDMDTVKGPGPVRMPGAQSNLEAMASRNQGSPLVGRGPYGAPLTREQIAANGQRQAAQQRMITQAGASAAGAALGDIKSSPQYQAAANKLDEIRRRFGSNRSGMFQDPEYLDATRAMAGILHPVDVARGGALNATRDVFAKANSGFNQDFLEAGAAPLTIEAMQDANRNANRQSLATTGMIDARSKYIGAQTGQTEAETKEIPENARSTREVQGSEAGLNKAKADNLPKETEAKMQGSAELDKAQNQALSLKQTLEQQNQQMASLKSQITELRALLKERGVDLVSNGQNFEQANDRVDESKTGGTGGSFNGSKSPLASNAGGGAVASTRKPQTFGASDQRPAGGWVPGDTWNGQQLQADGRWVKISQ